MRPEVRRAVSAAIRRADGRVLAVRRPDEPGEELPGVWGLPAVTLREGDSPEDGVRRIGWEKLGVELTPLRALADGEQQRAQYTLHMTVYEASMTGEPKLPERSASSGTRYEAIDWLPPASFREGAERGSLCCALFLDALSPGPSPASGRGEANNLAEARQWIRLSPQLREQMVDVARRFRKDTTRSEALLWQALRRKSLGTKFRRQHPIGPFVVDFYCHSCRLVVEVDGPIHASQRVADSERQHLIEEAGLRFLRLSAADVENNLPMVLDRIAAALKVTSQIPLSRERERG